MWRLVFSSDICYFVYQSVCLTVFICQYVSLSVCIFLYVDLSTLETDIILQSRILAAKLLNVLSAFLRRFIYAHGMKIQGRGYLKFLPKSLGGSKLSGKIGKGVPLSKVKNERKIRAGWVN
jgi:hypothetical protein